MKKRITFLFIVFCALLLPWQGSAQTTGSTCNNPLLVYATPFNDAGNTGTYGNNYSSSDVPPEAPGAVTDGTGSTSYLNGNDVVYSYTAGSNGSITINTTHSGSSDWHSLWVFTGCPFTATVGYHTQTTGTTRSISNLPVTMGQTYYIVISNWNSGDMDYTIDITGTQVMNPPTCLPPGNLTVSNVSATSVDLGWTETGSATTWDIEWGVEGFTPTGTPTISGVTSNPYTLSTGLSPQTKYDFYVRADCGGGDFSFWTGPFTFETACTSQLSGTYSIGGAAADFATLTDAVASLNDCGVSGPVVFNVTPGSGPFNEQLIITEFMGSSSTNTVTFNGNGETLSAPTTGDSRSLFLLDGADYVTITDFNLVTISDSNNFVIQLTNDADFNVISNNTIDMSSTLGSTSTSNAGILVGGSLTSATATTGTSGSNNTISGNTIYGGYYGINVNGQSSTPSLNNTISDNTLEDFYSYGISLRYNNNSIVTNNDISRPTRVTVSTFYGIYLASGGEGNALENNRIHTPFGGITATSTSANYGIYHTANDSPIGNESLVVNNIVHLTGNNGTIYALYNSNSDGVHYYHNTVVLDDVNATAGTTRGFYQTGTADNIEIKNNIFSIMREGSGAKYCLYFGASASVIVSDHNVLHMASTSGTTGIGYSGSGQSTLADWQTATSGDMNSVDVNPLFVNRLGGDFTPSNAAVNNIGTPVGVATDFDGNLRNTTTPDPGAYEFTPPACPQPSALDVSNITATTADLSWTENGTASNWDIEWGPKGFVPTEIPTLSTTTNPHTLTGLTALREYDFYVRANCGGGDESTWVGPYTFRAGCPGPLAGSYSVGASGDFFTLTDVAYALNTCGISASVTFNLLPGSGPYEEQIILEEIVGASATNTITLNGNGETLTAMTTSGTRSLILLDGTDYTTIVNFNFVTQSETNNFVVQLTGNADYNTITNNTFDMSSTIDNTGSTNVGIVVSGSLTSATSTTGNSGTNNIFVGNTIIGGYYGISVYGQSSTRSLDNIISDNIIQDFYSTGIRVAHNNNSVVSNNDISRPSRSNITAFYGIYFISGGEGHIVANNKIHNPFGGTTSRSSTASYGIYHSGNDSPIGNESQVINNIVNLTGSDGTIYALYNSNSDGVYYYHNTVSLDDMNATSGTTRGFYQTAAATNIEVKNNIFSITRTGSGVKYCLYFNTASSVITSDHNVLHMGATDGTTAIGYSGSAHTTLADWQTATLGDSNSVDADPLFINPLSLDFSPSNPAVDNIGTPVGVASDINGNARSATTPDAGAYEFTPPSCISPSFIQVSNVTTSSADIVWQENGTATEWEVEYGQSGFTQGSGTVVVDNDGTLGISLSSLTDNTLYDVYVRAICSSTDESAWYGPYTFKTECAPFSLPYAMDFETSMNQSPDCWSNSGWEFGTSPTNGNNYSGNGGSGYFAFVDASSPYKPDATLTSPLIDISGLTSPKLEFYKYHYDANTSSTSVSNKLTVEVYDGAAWNIVHLDDNGDVNAWEKVEIDLTTLTITGDIQVRFIVDTDVGSNFYNDIGIDDVSFTGIMPCADPSVIVITNVTHNSADVSWTENGTATEWEIEYGLSGFTQGSGTVVVDNDGTLGETLTGLDAEETYDVYVRAICSSTISSAWIGPVSFTTLEPPCADPSAIVVTNITYNSADISWTENGTATEWEIEYGLSGFTQGSGTVVVDNDGTLGETLTGLSDDSAYDMYVRAICSSTNASAWIGSVSFTTLEAPCADPSAIVVTNITYNSADISWTENGTATEWEIEYGLSGFTQGSGTVIVDNDGTLGETLTGLSDDSAYDVYVRAICSSTNASAWIGPVSFTTLEAPCTDPSAIVISNVTYDSANISWTENGTATEWEIEYGLSGFTQGSGTVVVDNDGTLGETLTGLDAEESYDVYVRAICSSTNASAWVGPVSFTTLEAPCADPSAIVVTNVTYDSADISWTENGTATEWEIEYGLSGFTQGSGTVVVDNDGTLGETLTGLDAEETYDVYVRAICSSTNASAWVGPVSFMTTTVNVADHDFSGFTYYPNPMEEVLNISSTQELYDITLFNIVGQQILTHKMNASSTSIDVSHLASGSYMMQVVSESGQVKYVRLIKE